MIRINLLPFRVARKKENIRRQISIFLLLIALTGAGLFYLTLLVNQQIQTVKDETAAVKQQIAKYKAKAIRVQKIKKDLKILQQKLAVVRSLKSQRNKQVILFDTMTDLVVPDRMWLSDLKTTAQTVSVKGIAFDNPTIAEFMKNLEKSVLFSKVDLKTAKTKKFKGDVLLKEFELSCRKTQPKQEKKKPAKKGKK